MHSRSGAGFLCIVQTLKASSWPVAPGTAPSVSCSNKNRKTKKLRQYPIKCANKLLAARNRCLVFANFAAALATVASRSKQMENIDKLSTCASCEEATNVTRTDFELQANANHNTYL